MLRATRMLTVVAVASVLAMGNLAGCTKKPNQEELAKLEQARSAAESAEKKLAELRAERQQLEQTLDQKKGELKEHEAERDDLKAKMGQSQAPATTGTQTQTPAKK
jgi:septal ring factor EnvC (AmiA/AmiB activator)